jgi:signal transduction histidine kinase
MADQINLYLDRARMAARIGVIGRITEVRPVGESIVRALERIYRDKVLSFSVECPPAARFQGERQDLEEMLGNLLDNAAKWAQGQVLLSATPLAEGFRLPVDTANQDDVPPVPKRWLEIRVDDDGPGLTPEQLAAPISRGRRLDETKPGSGLGHSIVADLAHSYGGKLTLAKAELGGLSARLHLPLAAD